MFCPRCGRPAESEANYCANCGAALPSTISQPDGQAPDTPREIPADPSEYRVINDEARPRTSSLRRARGNFFAKHWAGNYPLGFSYWVIGFLGTFLAGALIKALDLSAIPLPDSSRAAGLTILTLYGGALVFSIWQLTGIWRSADKHPGRGGLRLWAALAKFAVILGALRLLVEFNTIGTSIFSEAFKLTAGIDDVPAYQLRLLRDGTEIELAGGMPFGTADAVQKMLDGAPAVHVIHLNSIGGRVSEGYKLYQLIKKRNLITYTASSCASACTIAFLAGRERYLGDSGQLGFHSVSIGDVGGDVSEGLNDDLRHTLLAHGVSKDFIDRALSTPPQQMWYPSAQELLRAKVIDSVVDSRYFGMSGIGQWRDAHQMEQELLEIPIFAALARYDAQSYEHVHELVISSVRRGRAMIDVQRDVRTLFAQEILPKYTVIAPDAAISRYWRSLVAQMRYLSRSNAQACADLAFPEYAKATPDFTQLLPHNLQQHQLNALADLIVGAATNPKRDRLANRVEADLQLIRVQAERSYPGNLQVLNHISAYRSQPAVLCYTAIATYSAILSLPENRAGPVLRYMAAQ